MKLRYKYFINDNTDYTEYQVEYNGKIVTHRDEGPAFIGKNKIWGTGWFYYGKLHRIDGPALIFTQGTKRREWWFHGVRYASQP